MGGSSDLCLFPDWFAQLAGNLREVPGGHDAAPGPDLHWRHFVTGCIAPKRQHGVERQPGEDDWLAGRGNARGLVVWIPGARSEAPTSELKSLMRTSYALSCLKKKT